MASKDTSDALQQLNRKIMFKRHAHRTTMGQTCMHESHKIKAASKLQLYHSLVVNTIPDNNSHTVYRTIIALIIAVVKVNYVHLLS